jgi:hypothetical protein
MASITSQKILQYKNIIIENDKGAEAFATTSNPILDLFTETRKCIPEDKDEFVKLVKKIELAKNSNPEMFIKLLKFHRLIEKGNGMKGIYYLCMIVLKEEDPDMYEYVLNWSRQYAKDILRLARLSSMFNPTESTSGETIQMDIKNNLNPNTNSNKSKRQIKLSAWAKTETKAGNIKMNQQQQTVVSLSPEIALYSHLLFDTIKLIVLGKMFDPETNLMLFKYIGYETSHFAVESNIIWKYVEYLLQTDPEVNVLINA